MKVFHTCVQLGLLFFLSAFSSPTLGASGNIQYQFRFCSLGDIQALTALMSEKLLADALSEQGFDDDEGQGRIFVSILGCEYLKATYEKSHPSQKGEFSFHQVFGDVSIETPNGIENIKFDGVVSLKFRSLRNDWKSNEAQPDKGVL